MENENVKIVKCDLIQADKPTINERIYPIEVLQKAIKEYNKEENDIGSFSVNRNRDLSLNLAKVTHKILYTWLDDDGFLNSKISILETPEGKILKNMWSENIKLFPTFIVEMEDYIIKEIKIMALDVNSE